MTIDFAMVSIKQILEDRDIVLDEEGFERMKGVLEDLQNTAWSEGVDFGEQHDY